MMTVDFDEWKDLWKRDGRTISDAERRWLIDEVERLRAEVERLRKLVCTFCRDDIPRPIGETWKHVHPDGIVTGCECEPW